MRLKIGAPRVIVRGGKCEDTPWGFYQFPKLFAGEDGVKNALLHLGVLAEEDLAL